MTDRFAYRASDEFTAACLARLNEVREFDTDVLTAAHDELDPYLPMFTYGLGLQLDRTYVGFTDADPCTPPPAGLSRAKTRRELRPKPGKAGDPWRAQLAKLNERPKFDPLLAAYGVDGFVLNVGAISSPAVSLDEDTPALWMLYAAMPAATEHLIPIQLSEYYAAREALDERRSVPSMASRKDLP